MLKDSPETPSDPAAWSRLLERLESQREQLVDDFLERLSQQSAYGQDDVPADDLRATASETMEMLIRRIAGVPLSPQQRELPRRLGVRRARQGVARESLLEAVRLDFRVLWSGLVRANEGASGDLIVLHAEDLLTTVEQYIGDVQEAFLDEQAALARDSRIDVSQAFARLLAAGDNAEEVARAVVERLGVPLNAHFEVVVVPVSASADARAWLHLRERGRSVMSWDFDDSVALMREQLPESTWSDSLSDVPGGLVRDIEGLAGVPRAVRVARAISQHVRADDRQFRSEVDVWPLLVRERAIDALPELDRIAASMAHIAEDEQLRLHETFANFVQTGSLKQTALHLYCHRNTVVNRLNTIHRVTGLNPMVPVDAARLILAFGPAVTTAWAGA